MVQKHIMAAGFEHETYDSDKLKEAWKQSLNAADRLVEAKWTSPPLRSFIEWINGNSYSGIFFPGFSLGTLLISKPTNGKLNYQRTLSIKYDNQTDIFTMEYSDWDLIESADESEKAVLWTLKCPGIDLVRHFMEFLNWKQDWV